MHSMGFTFLPSNEMKVEKSKTSFCYNFRDDITSCVVLAMESLNLRFRPEKVIDAKNPS